MRHIRFVLSIVLLALVGVMPAARVGQAQAAVPSEGQYIVKQLQLLTAHNWARVAGEDAGLPPGVNGHDEFVSAWFAEMRRNLRGIPFGLLRQPFTPSGFVGLPAPGRAANVVVTVPGRMYPRQAIVIGAHPDGEPWSKGSAYDDASGCAIILGLARVLGSFWRTHGLPALTVEFVLFDAEEQGLDGSIAYVYDLRHGALLPRPVFMIDEEQNGIGYPIRPFGRLSSPVAPAMAVETPPNPAKSMGARLMRRIEQATSFTAPRPVVLRRAERRIVAARKSAFTDLHALYPSIPYRGGSAPAFRPEDQHSVQLLTQAPGGSDNQPFEALGLPTVTPVGDGSFYDSNPPPWAFPFDQPEDTFTALACDSSGSPQPSTALAAALALPMMLSYYLVQAYAPAGTGSGLTVVSTPAGAGAATQFTAVGSGTHRWSFGDGAQTEGTRVSHTYRQPGTYTVMVSSGQDTLKVQLTVAAAQPMYRSKYRAVPPPRKPWKPAQLASIPGCS